MPFYLSFPLPFFASLLRPTKVHAHQRDRTTVEQRRGINNPEFPAGVPIIRFQGPPILAESYVRRRIYGLSSRPPHQIHSSLFPFLSQCPPDPLLSPDASFSSSLPPLYLSLFFSLPSSLPLLPSSSHPLWIPHCKLCQSGQTKSGFHPCKCVQHIYGTENCRTLTAKNTVA